MAILRRRFRKLNAVPAAWRPGFSIVIPERDNPDLLARCLESLQPELATLQEPFEIIVVVNGTPPSAYTALRSYPVEWIFAGGPLPYVSAIEKGLHRVRHDWVYLLNNDMVLQPSTLARVLACRAPDVFSVASQIFLEDPHAPRVESNWTASRIEDGIVGISDLIPDPGDTRIRENLYSGGGSSLFRTALLRQTIRFSAVYDPFYWEDVEWGSLAARSGYRNLFCPASRVTHTRRATIGKFNAPEEIDRVFRRNGLLYQLRNRVEGGSFRKLISAIASEDSRTFREILTRAVRD
jgi:GT2 family glycosyltransferase